MAVANTLAYYDLATITRINIFIVQTPGGINGAAPHNCATKDICPPPLMNRRYILA